MPRKAHRFRGWSRRAEWGLLPRGVVLWRGAVGAGELRAFNFATKDSKRPRYRIWLADLERFKDSRLVIPSAPVVQQRRRTNGRAVKRFF
jgi:hypothetical protein